MARVLLVEDDPKWMSIYVAHFNQLGLDELVIDQAAHLKDAIDYAAHFAEELMHYAAVIDSHFKGNAGLSATVEYLGLKAARQFKEMGIPYERIAFVSDTSDVLQEARRLGMRIYHKSKPDKKAGERHWVHLARETRPYLI